MVQQYRKKPVVISAIQWTRENTGIVMDFFGGSHVQLYEEAKTILIRTLEGIMEAHVGDYIIKGVKGEFYPCKPDIFEQTYEVVDGTPRSEA